MTQPPDMSRVSTAALMDELRELVPHYTPEWRFTPDHPDAGTALMLAFAKMFAGNLERFNQVPFRNLLAYLYMLGVEPRPANPSTVYVCFGSAKTSGDTWVPAGSTLSASQQDEDGSPLTFELEHAISVTSGRIQAMIVVHGAEDTIAEVAMPASAEPFDQTLDVFGHLDANNLQQHVFWVGSRQLFRCRGPLQIRLHFQNSKANYREPGLAKRLTSEDVRWSYWDGDNWVMFDAVILDDLDIVLEKRHPGDMAVADDDGPKMRWIRCEVLPARIHQLVDTPDDFFTDGVKLQVNRIHGPEDQGLSPDFQIGNDIEPDGEGYHPFGERFSINNMWYLANDETLTKRGAMVEVSFQLGFKDVAHGRQPQLNIRWRPIMRESQFKLPTPPRLHVHQVIWEYFNGLSWVRLDVDVEAADMFRTGSGERVRVRFVCPDDLALTQVKSRPSYWIRVRVLSMDTGFGAYNIFVSPWVEDVRFDYHYLDYHVQPDLVRADNNLKRSELGIAGQAGKGIHLFESLGTTRRALYFGLTDALKNGPFSLYLSIRDGGSAVEPNAIEWSYLSRRGEEVAWKPLQVLDETDALHHSGTVRFMVSDPMELTALFNESLYWIRCEVGDLSFVHTRLRLAGVYLNGAKASQRARVEQEVPHVMANGFDQAYAVAHASLLEEAVWVDETNHLTSSQLKEIPEASLRVIRNSAGAVLRVWVKWQPVQSFLMSSPLDRHYVVDRQQGIFQFGDGQQGRKPGAASTSVRIDYTYGGGVIGNIPSGSITTLQNAIPFINGVTNPDAAYGGKDVESLADAVDRGTHLARHQNRAVTAEDFECLAREASTLVKEAKCLGNVNGLLMPEPGSAALVVLPSEPGHPTFVAAEKAIETYLVDKSVSLLQTGRNLYIVPPEYIEVSVRVTVVVSDLDVAVPARMTTMSRLAEYLDTYSGGLMGEGWRIGDFVHPSAIYGLLKSVPQVKLVQRVLLSAAVRGEGGMREIDLEAAAKLHHGVVKSGVHVVDVEVFESEVSVRA